MKKLLYTIVLLASFFVLPNISRALTSDEVKLTITTKEGYVGAADITIKFTGDVTFDKLEWDSSIPSSYIKRYDYNVGNKTLRVFAATGSVSKNLVDNNHHMTLGTIKVKANGRTYDIALSQLVITDMDFELSSTSNLTTDKANGTYYTLEEKKTSNPNPGEDKPSNPGEEDKPSNPGEEDKPSNPSEGETKPSNPGSDNKTPSSKPSGTTNNGTSSTTNNNSTTNSSSNNQSTTDSNADDSVVSDDTTDSDTTTPNDEKVQNDKDKQESNNDKEEQKTKKKSFDINSIIIGILGSLIIIAAIIYLYRLIRK